MTDTSRPTPRVLLAAFQGWGDAGEAATDTLQHLSGLLDVEPLHTIGSSGFIDLQAHRPKLTRGPGGVRSLEWPDTRLLGPVARPAHDQPFIQPDARDVTDAQSSDFAEAEDQAHDQTPRPVDDERMRRIDGSPVTEVYLLAGYEPAYHWQDFAEEIVDLVDTWAIDTVILIGSMYAEAPHSRQIATTITSENARLREASGAELSSYEGPVGIMTVIEMALTAADVPAMSLWAQVPHYVHSAPSPKATLALLDKLEELLDVVIPRGELLAQSNDWESHINRIAAGDEEMSQYIRTLERARDEALAAGTTGDAIALEFEKLLGAMPGEVLPGAPHPRDAAAGPDPDQDQGPEATGPQPEEP